MKFLILMITITVFSTKISSEDWKSCFEGCKQEPYKLLVWEKADEFCKKYATPNENWRLPTIDQLKNFLNKEKNLKGKYWADLNSDGKSSFYDSKNNIVGSYSKASSNKLQVLCTKQKPTKKKEWTKESIDILKNILPINWYLSLVEENLVILERNEGAWKFFENKINAPINDKKKSSIEEKLTKKKEPKIPCTIQLLGEEEWSKEKLDFVTKKNLEIFNLLEELNNDVKPKKMNKSIDYNSKRKELQDSMIRLPDYKIDKVYIFIKEISCLEDEYYTIIPKDASDESYKIINSLEKFMFINQ
ncbi:MAG: hypothetical protein SFU98_04375 [Leptospiraceae bacterium]|nr:hypothetical protein [Leptospiraceae bacterium]